MSQLQLLKSFLENLLLASLAILLLLSLLLVSSLTTLELAEKSKEFAIFRALGLSSISLFLLLIAQALSFSIPGLFLGILFSKLSEGIVQLFLQDFCMIGLEDTGISAGYLALIIIVGIGTPLFGNLAGIIKTLGRPIHEELKGNSGGVAIWVGKLESLGVGSWEIACGSLLVLIGGIAYYVVPKAILLIEMDVLLRVLNFILLGMIGGLTVMLDLTRIPLEKGLRWIIFRVFRGERGLEGLVANSMERHRERNGKIGLMFGLTVAFVIFGGTGTLLLKEILHKTLQRNYGADMTAEVGVGNMVGLDEMKIREYLSHYEKVNEYQLDL